jgi:ubiquinone/menaquinone biosynthesis C-methylase UbiE
MHELSRNSPFAGAAAYYSRFRAPYPQAAITSISKRRHLSGRARALDLGCGPGTIAIPLSLAIAEVLAVDPDADMIVEGQRLALLQGQQNIRWLMSRAEDISLPAEKFQIATIGQAFHWMDRDKVLEKLVHLLEDEGILALVNPGKRRPQESWEMLAEQIVRRFLGPQVRHAGSNPKEPEHEPALLRSSCFSDFTSQEFESTITRDIPSIIGCIYSRSRSVRSFFKDDVEVFESELTLALLRLSPSGIFHEQTETEVIIAPKKTR